MLFSASLNFKFVRTLRVQAAHLRVCVSEKRNFGAQRIEIEQMCFETVVQIGCVVGNLVTMVNELRFKRAAFSRADIRPVQAASLLAANNRANA